MMTNAGNHTCGIEFDPNCLIRAIHNNIVAGIGIEDKDLPIYDHPQCTNPKSIGIITGNGPDSGIALWKGINRYILEELGEDHFLGDMSLPEVHVISLPAMGLSMELDKREIPTWDVLSSAVKFLKAQNVDLLTLACHTTHYFEEKIREIFDSESQHFVSMPEVVIDHIVKNEYKEIAVLGINYVADLKEWSAYSRLSEYVVEIIDDKTMRQFHTLGYDVKQMVDAQTTFQKLLDLLNNKIKSKCVVIALTELSLILQQKVKSNRKSDRIIIDSLDLYAKEIARLSLGL